MNEIVFYGVAITLAICALPWLIDFCLWFGAAWVEKWSELLEAHNDPVEFIGWQPRNCPRCPPYKEAKPPGDE